MRDRRKETIDDVNHDDGGIYTNSLTTFARVGVRNRLYSGDKLKLVLVYTPALAAACTRPSRSTKSILFVFFLRKKSRSVYGSTYVYQKKEIFK